MVINMLLLTFSLICIQSVVESARILAVYPAPSISHQVVFRALTEELLKRGHEVTVITTDPAYSNKKKPDNLTEIDVHDISYGFLHKIHEDYKVPENEELRADEYEVGIFMATVFEIQLNSPEVQKLFFHQRQQFDLILIEAIVRPALAVTYIFEAPVILVSSLGATTINNDAIGALSHPTLYPSIFDQRIYNLSIWEKIKTLYQNLKGRYIVANPLENYENMILQKYFGPNIPPLCELSDNIDMLFLNVNPIWSNNQPVPPNVVYMGGIHQVESQELPKDLKHYLDSSHNGVIYLSFGTNALPSMISTEKIKIIVKVLSELPYNVLMKWDQDVLPISSNNIKLSKWFPQADLLKHPNIKLFITQAGLQSTDEAITAGVPLLAIPMLGDQWYNAERYVTLGIGKKLRIGDMDLHTFKTAIETVISDESYRQNIISHRQLILDQPQTPLERSMWWIEYVLRHGGAKHLRAPTANISWSQYYELDVLFVILFVFVLSVLILVSIIRCILALVKKSNKKIKSS